MERVMWIREGDRAACGGMVIEGDEDCTSHGLAHAFEGARLICKKRCVIAEGVSRPMLTNGRKAVVHGMKTSAGCQLLSTLNDHEGAVNSVAEFCHAAHDEQAALLAPDVAETSDKPTGITYLHEHDRHENDDRFLGPGRIDGEAVLGGHMIRRLRRVRAVPAFALLGFISLVVAEKVSQLLCPRLGGCRPVDFCPIHACEGDARMNILRIAVWLGPAFAFGASAFAFGGRRRPLAAWLVLLTTLVVVHALIMTAVR